jgi:hypothetical protein
MEGLEPYRKINHQYYAFIGLLLGYMDQFVSFES